MSGLATDSAGNIFITDDYYDKIYRIDAATGAVTTFAGIGAVGNTGTPQGDGSPATLAGLGRPFLIIVDPFGNVFFVEQYWLRRIDGKTGIITTIGPNANGSTGSSGDGGPWNKATFANITAIATDSKGNLYIADEQHLRKIDWSTGIISTIAGSGQQVYAGDGVPAIQANLSFMTGIVIDAQGNIWLADSGNARLFLIAASTGLIGTIAGTSPTGDGGPALGALLSGLGGLAVNADGDLYFDANGIRKVDHTTGIISTIAPQTKLAAGGLGNGESPIALDRAGNIFVTSPAALQRVDAATGNVTIVAGDGAGLYGGGPLGDDGPATKAQVTPVGAAIDSAGDIYIADYWNERIRRVDAATGIIGTVAGNGNGQTFSGSTGPATQISIGVPTAIAIAPDGDIYWTTAGWVLRMNTAGSLSIAAGNGGCVYAGDGGPATAAPLCSPGALAFDTAGNFFISQSSCGCVRRVDVATGIIQTVAGTESAGVSDDGIPATQAALSPTAIAFSAGTLYIADAPQLSAGPARVRAVTPATPPALPQPPSITQVVDAFDYRTIFSPGAIVSVFGNYLGAESPLSGQTGADGRITTTLGGDRVGFNGIPAPLLYVSAGQINAIVPYATAHGNIPVQVSTNAGTNSSDISVLPSSLSLIGGLIFNSDGTLNSAGNPASKGSTLVLYGTGMGQTSPAGLDGSIVGGPPFPSPLTPFSAMVQQGGTQYPAVIQYLGPLPDFVAGAVQLNIRIPHSLPAGKSTLYVGPTGDLPSGAMPQTIYTSP